MENFTDINDDRYFSNESEFLPKSEQNSTENFDHAFESIILKFRTEPYLSPTAEIAFVVCYVLVIVAGVMGNVMIGYVIWRKKTMRTPRNLYIINLTLSDLSMCIFCIPFTLVELLNKDFSMGVVICKSKSVIQCTNIMISVLTIVAIAADRYAAIVVGISQKTHIYVGKTLCAIWIVSFTFSLPFLSWYDVKAVKLRHYLLYRRCIMDSPSKSLERAYLLFLMVMMYVAPIIVLSTVHASIKRYLARHIVTQNDSRREQREIDRNRKTTILLTAIAVAFGVSWLPVQISNLLADFNYSGFHDPKTLYTVIGSCHLIAMSTVCTNPILYGWLNTNLRRELMEFVPSLAKRIGLRLSWSLESSTKQDQGDSPTRGLESVTYSTVVLQARHSPRNPSCDRSSVSLLTAQTSNLPPRKLSRRSNPPSPTGQATVLKLMPRSPTIDKNVHSIAVAEAMKAGTFL